MSFTDLATVRKHLVASNIPSLLIENTRITLVGTTDLDLPHDNLVNGSEIVKRFSSGIPTRDTGVLLTNEDEVPLSAKNLVRDSVVAASDLALSSIFSEELDYRVDHEAGTIQRMAAGAIPNSYPVAVWFDNYKIFELSADYVMDYPQGKIRRAAGSTIPDGATLMIDYTISQGSAEDTLIEQSIVEAHDIIERGLRDGYDGTSTDQGLKTGATYLTLAIVARGMAALALTKNTGTDANSRAREWQQLSEKWTAAAWNVLAPFVNPHLLRSIVVE